MAVILSTALGLTFGLGSRFALHFDLDIVISITQSFSFWALVTASLTRLARTPLTAALCAFICYFSMNGAYYLLQGRLYGYVDTGGFIEWMIVAAVVSIATFFIWFGHGDGPVAVACGVWPFLVCLIDLFDLLIIFHGELYLAATDIAVSAICLVLVELIIPKSAKHKIIMPLLSVAAAAIIVVLPYIIFTGR